MQTYPTAEYFTNWDEERLNQLYVLPPYEPRDRVATWVRGSIRHRYQDDLLRDLVITGPKMKVCFGGCNWNRIVFAMNGLADTEVYKFERWVRGLAKYVKDTIWAEPGKYKAGAVSSSRFTFDDDFIKPANDPAKYPDELRCKLSTRRETVMDGGEPEEIVDADLFTINSEGEEEAIDHQAITAGSHVIPVMTFRYYRNGERFGLNVTVLKGLVYPAEKVNHSIDNRDWQMDIPLNEA